MNSAHNFSGAMPRLTPLQWQQTGALARWFIVSRGRVLGLTLFPCLLAALLAVDAGLFEWRYWLLCLMGLLLAHAANNQLNDLVDSTRGVDAGDYFRRQYGTQVLEDGFLSRRALTVCFLGTGGLAALAGVALVWLSGWLVALPFLAGALLLVFYTHPLKTLGLGEVAVLLVWGPLMTGGTYLATTGEWLNSVAWLGTVCALGPAAVIFGKHIDKVAQDRARGVRTLPVRLGAARSRWLVIALVLLQLCATFWLVGTGVLGWPLLLITGALPAAWRLCQVLRFPAPQTCPDGFPEGVWPLWYVAHAFVYSGRFAALFLIGFAAALLVD
ncbi:MAG: prenyltransferase [Pseudomonadales bacterium]